MNMDELVYINDCLWIGCLSFPETDDEGLMTADNIAEGEERRLRAIGQEDDDGEVSIVPPSIIPLQPGLSPRERENYALGYWMTEEMYLGVLDGWTSPYIYIVPAHNFFSADNIYDSILKASADRPIGPMDLPYGVGLVGKPDWAVDAAIEFAMDMFKDLKGAGRKDQGHIICGNTWELLSRECYPGTPPLSSSALRNLMGQAHQNYPGIIEKMIEENRIITLGDEIPEPPSVYRREGFPADELEPFLGDDFVPSFGATGGIPYDVRIAMAKSKKQVQAEERIEQEVERVMDAVEKAVSDHKGQVAAITGSIAGDVAEDMGYDRDVGKMIAGGVKNTMKRLGVGRAMKWLQKKGPKGLFAPKKDDLPGIGWRDKK